MFLVTVTKNDPVGEMDAYLGRAQRHWRMCSNAQMKAGLRHPNINNATSQLITDSQRANSYTATLKISSNSHVLHERHTKMTANDPTTIDPPLPINHHDGRSHLLLCATGSVATIKIPNIITALASHPRLSIRLILTPSATHFLAGQAAEQPSLAAIRRLPNVEAIYTDADEWTTPWKRGGPVLHIELRRWADLLVVAPLSANSLAKMAGGWADGLLLSVVRAWDTTGLIDGLRVTAAEQDGSGSVEGEETAEGMAGTESADGRAVGVTGKKVIVVAVAMNTAMWNHPVTRQHVKTLEGEWGVDNGGWVQVMRPVEKELACGDTGSGAMADWKDIVKVIEKRLGLGSGRSV